MFTGIIQEIGTIQAIHMQGNTGQLEIHAPKTASNAALGDSICTNGVCLTVAQLSSDSFRADLSNETLIRTAFSQAKEGTAVNIEPSLRPTDRLGGHFVAGHVDGVGTVVSMDRQDEFIDLIVAYPPELAPFIAEKGSIAIDGISLTVTHISDDAFGVAVIPFTMQETNLQHRQPGDRVNLEADMLARYVQRMLKYNTHQKDKPITIETLKGYGYPVE